jgi:hypothetical protein
MIKCFPSWAHSWVQLPVFISEHRGLIDNFFSHNTGSRGNRACIERVKSVLRRRLPNLSIQYDDKLSKINGLYTHRHIGIEFKSFPQWHDIGIYPHFPYYLF